MVSLSAASSISHACAGVAVQLAWSCDSELLAVLRTPSNTTATTTTTDSTGATDATSSSPQSSGHTLQVWHRSNWHWHLKYQREYPAAVSLGAEEGMQEAGDAGDVLQGRHAVPLLQWDEQRPGRLHVVAPGPGPGTTAYEQVRQSASIRFSCRVCMFALSCAVSCAVALVRGAVASAPELGHS